MATPRVFFILFFFFFCLLQNLTFYKWYQKALYLPWMKKALCGHVYAFGHAISAEGDDQPVVLSRGYMIKTQVALVI